MTLNGELVNDFQTTATNRGLAPGFIGLQNHGAGDAISFRDIRIMELEAEPDEDPPVTSHALSPANPNGNNGWYRSSVDVTLTADDGEGGSGVEETEYSIDGGAFQAYGGPFTISADGEHTVEYRSTDVAGNVEATKSVEVSVDRTDPTTTASLDPPTPGPGGVYEVPVEVTLDGDDGAQGSGIDRIQYRRGTSGPFQAYQGALTVSAPGEHTIQFRSIDAAGNFEAPGEVSFTIEEEPPPEPSVEIAASPKTVKLRAFLRRGVEIDATCEAVDDGALMMTVTKPVANRLGLERLLLARAELSCEGGSASGTLEPGGKVSRALEDARRSVRTTLRLRMSGDAGTATDSRPLVLERTR